MIKLKRQIGRISAITLMIIGCFVIYMLYVLSIYDVNGLGTRDEEKLPSEIHGRVEKMQKEVENNFFALSKLREHLKKLNIPANKKHAQLLPVANVDKLNTPESKKPAKTLPATKRQPKPTSKQNKATPTIPVLMLACNRPSVSRSLDSLLKFKPTASPDQFPIIVSQDGNHRETMNAIKAYGGKITYLQHLDDNLAVPPNHNNLKGYYKLSAHFKWAIAQAFSKFPTADALIIVEDDLEFSPDFFSYFANLHPLLSDPSLLCVSAWNDNGKDSNVDSKSGHSQLYRSDFFPGLGWMLSRRMWEELEPKWPAAFWDDWLRDPEQRKDRACIRPEICRTKTFGRVGVSNGQFYDKHLKFIKLNDRDVDWSKQDLTYLRKDNYDKQFFDEINALPLVSLMQLRVSPDQYREVKVEYSQGTFKSLAKQLDIMDDLKSGVPRTAYRGVVTTMFNKVRVYLVPDKNWKGYS